MSKWTILAVLAVAVCTGCVSSGPPIVIYSTPDGVNAEVNVMASKSVIDRYWDGWAEHPTAMFLQHTAAAGAIVGALEIYDNNATGHGGDSDGGTTINVNGDQNTVIMGPNSAPISQGNPVSTEAAP